MRELPPINQRTSRRGGEREFNMKLKEIVKIMERMELVVKRALTEGEGVMIELKKEVEK